MGTSLMVLPTGPSLIREVDILGVFRYANTYPAALALLSSGQLGNVETMVTHKFQLKDTEEAFRTVARGKGPDGHPCIKVMIGKN
jgi:L-iditol 2-dehydrogenase